MLPTPAKGVCDVKILVAVECREFVELVLRQVVLVVNGPTNML